VKNRRKKSRGTIEKRKRKRETKKDREKEKEQKRNMHAPWTRKRRPKRFVTPLVPLFTHRNIEINNIFISISLCIYIYILYIYIYIYIYVS